MNFYITLEFLLFNLLTYIAPVLMLKDANQDALDDT